MEKTLYPWQSECLERWFANGCRGIVQAVTGSGKTMLALEAAEQLEKKTGKKVLVKIVVPTAALMRQWNRALRTFLENRAGVPAEIGLRGGGQKSPSDRRYMIYVINSARYELARQILADLHKGEQVFLVADECHHYASGENQLIFEFLPFLKEQEAQFFCMGLSATLPSESIKTMLSSFLGRCIYDYGIENALEAKTVCGYDVYHIEVPLSVHEKEEYEKLTDHMRLLYRKILKTKPYLKGRTQRELYEELCKIAGDKRFAIAKDAALYMKLSFKRKETVCLAAARNQCAVCLVEMLGIGQKILVFGERIRQAEELYRILQERFPEKIGRYHSGQGEQANKNALERFRDGEYRILIACKSLDEGIDIPDAAIGIILSGTSGQRQRTQRLGRIIRKADGKERASLYYLHAAETAEDHCFLPNRKHMGIYELKFCPDTHKVSHEIYDRRAEMIFGEMCQKQISFQMQQEIANCLYRGSIRSDWQKDEDEIRRCIAESESVRDRNYWICMQKMKGKSSFVLD